MDRIIMDKNGKGDYSNENTMIISWAENNIKGTYGSADIIKVGMMELLSEADNYKESVADKVDFENTKFKEQEVSSRTRGYIKTKKQQCKQDKIVWGLEAYHIHALEEVFPVCMFFPELGLLQYDQVNEDNAAHIDRMDPDPDVGYVPGNVRRISAKANMIKNQFRGELILAVGQGMAKKGL